MANDLKAFGAKTAALELEEQDNDFPVDEENWESVGLFLKLSTQWRVAGMGGFTGLDYAAVDAVFKIYRVKNRVDRLDDLRIMEMAALPVLNEKAKGASE